MKYKYILLEQYLLSPFLPDKSEPKTVISVRLEEKERRHFHVLTGGLALGVEFVSVSLEHFGYFSAYICTANINISILSPRNKVL